MGRLAVLAMAGACATREFLCDRREDEPAEADRHERAHVAHARHEQDEQHEHAAGERHDELTPQVRHRGAPPAISGPTPVIANSARPRARSPD